MSQSPELIDQIDRLMDITDRDIFISHLEAVLALLIKSSGEEYIWDIRRIVNPVQYGKIELAVTKYDGKITMLEMKTGVTKRYSGDKNNSS
jgi:hypothetical protein